MGRFLSILLLSASFVSTSAWAITIGQVSAYSSANKPLRMDVELVDLQGARVTDVFMRVADEIDHERFGLQRPAWADGSSARVFNKDSNSFVARLNSTRSVPGSDVDFVVELRAGSSVTWHKVSAALGSGSPLVALPPEPKPAAPRPVVEKTAPVPAPEPVPEPAPAPAPAPELDAEMAAFDANDVADDSAAFDVASLDDSAMDADQGMMFDAVYEDVGTVDFAPDMTAEQVTRSEAKLKSHEYFNRVLILFFILCFAIAGLINKLIKKIRKS